MINSRKLISLIIVVTILFTIAVGMEFSAMAQICDDYEYVVLEDGTAEITKYNGNESDLTIPNMLNDYAVTHIGEKAFYQNKDISHLTISQNIAIIGNSAFAECSNLEYITFPEVMFEIGENAFQLCDSLLSLNLPKGLTKISAYSFDRCYSLKSVVIPEGVISIEESAFSSGRTLKQVTLPSSLEKIEDQAFSYCAFTTIDLPKNLKSFGSRGAFSGSKLKNITIPDGVKELPWQLFSHCSELETVVIPDSVITIASEVFLDCNKLENIVLPKNLMNLSGFRGCENLQNFVVPNSVTCIYQMAFADCKSLTELVLPSKCKEIKVNAFKNCSNLTKITIKNDDCYIWNEAIPEQTVIYCSENSTAAAYAKEHGNPVVYFEEAIDYDYIVRSDGTVSITKYKGNQTDLTVLYELNGRKVVSIGDSAFSDKTQLQSILLPDELTGIGNSAFSGCSALSSIQIPSGVVFLGDNAFDFCNSLSEVFYPEAINLENTAITEAATKVSYKLDAKGEVVITGITLGRDKSSIVIPDFIAGKKVAQVEENIDKSIISKEGHTHNYYLCSCLICGYIAHSRISHYDRVEPTCIDGGKIEYYFCWECRKYFTDENNENEISYDDIEIKRTGHSFTNYIYNNDATYYNDGTETAQCDNCNEKNTRVKEGSKLEKPIVTDPPTEKPSDTEKPTDRPTEKPSDTEKPTEKPSDTQKPTEKPSEKPSDTEKPSEKPSDTQTPSEKPSEQPSDAPNPTEKPDESQKPSNDNSNKENPTDISNDSTITDKPTDKNEPSTTATTVPQNSLRNQEENTTVPASSYNIPTSNDYNSSYSPTPDNNNFASDSDIPTGIYNDSDFSDRQSQNYQENSAVNENDIVITIHVTEKSLILIIVLVVVIFVGVIAIIMVYKKKNDY
ncbi:MAG: leucine-rich repeat protein [Eubacterium sp.]|nr:leucine-rich repeat protein [Eubacterium sp.]